MKKTESFSQKHSANAQNTESYEYTGRHKFTVYYHNTLAGLGKLWREFKEWVRGLVYDIGSLVSKKYKNYTESSAHRPNRETPVEREGEEMFEYVNENEKVLLSETREDADLVGVTATQHAQQFNKRK